LKETRVIFSDIDDTITFTKNEDGKKVRVIDRKAIAKVKKLVKLGYKVAFITGKAEDYVRKEFIPLLDGFGIRNDIPIYGEQGFYEITGKKGVTMLPEAKAFLPQRARIIEEIKKEAKKHSINFVDVPRETKQVMVYFKLANPTPENRAELKKISLEAIANLRTRGEVSHKIAVNPTRSGCDIYPDTTSKANAVNAVLKKWGVSENVRGRAYGDMYVDLRLAQKPRVRFYRIDAESKQFIKEISHLNFKFWVRKMRGRIASVKRKIPRKIRKPLAIMRRVFPK